MSEQFPNNPEQREAVTMNDWGDLVEIARSIKYELGIEGQESFDCGTDFHNGEQIELEIRYTRFSTTGEDDRLKIQPIIDAPGVRVCDLAFYEDTGEEAETFYSQYDDITEEGMFSYFKKHFDNNLTDIVQDKKEKLNELREEQAKRKNEKDSIVSLYSDIPSFAESVPAPGEGAEKIAWTLNPPEYTSIDTHELQRLILGGTWLSPKTKQSISNDFELYFTDPIEFNNSSHTFIVGYSHNRRTNESKPHLYYMSNSHAMWRAAYSLRASDGGFDKGSASETEVTLPWQLQQTLNSLKEGDKTRLSVSETEVAEMFTRQQSEEEILHGIDDEYKDFELKFHEKKEINYFILSYLHGHRNQLPAHLSQQVEGLMPGPEPESVFAQWKGGNSTYKDVTYRVVPAKNGEFIYVFANDQEQGVWLTNIEVNNTTIRESGIKTSSPGIAHKVGLENGALVNATLLAPPIDHRSNQGDWSKEGYSKRNDAPNKLVQAYLNQYQST